jgi:hypothetical protein
LWVIKPLGEDSTLGTVKPLPVSLVEPGACLFSHILTSRRISRITAAEVVAILREPSLQPALGAAEAASEHVLLLLPRLALLDQQIRDVARRIGRALRELPASASIRMASRVTIATSIFFFHCRV